MKGKEGEHTVRKGRGRQKEEKLQRINVEDRWWNTQTGTSA